MRSFLLLAVGMLFYVIIVLDENGCEYDAKWKREGKMILNHFKNV